MIVGHDLDNRERGPWHPAIDASGRVLKGIEARTYYLLIEWGAWVGAGVLVAVLIGMIVNGTGWGGNPVLVLFIALLLIDALLYEPAVYIGMLVRRGREVRAGYTTMLSEFPEVDQVDQRTGRVVRLVGESLLRYEEYAERVRLVQEAVAAESAGGERSR